MPSDNYILVLQLSSPLQSWGFDSRYSIRNTGLFPTKSAISGLCCAASGIHRGTEAEKNLLSQIQKCSFTSIVVPNIKKIEEKEWKTPIRRIEDFHTIMGTKSADGKLKKDAVLTQRYYLCDANFLILLEGPEDLLKKLKQSLIDPVWGLWLGRKSCIPSKPIFAGLYKTKEEMIDNHLSGCSMDEFKRMEEVHDFDQGMDLLPDVAVSFDIQKRNYVARRINIYQAKKGC
ncbi:MAG: type I-E CRISPR-associated protein Cas5/CasD [Desulfobacula sp.]|jgi:CRISPR system Cascade subunit CasD